MKENFSMIDNIEKDESENKQKTNVVIAPIMPSQ